MPGDDTVFTSYVLTLAAGREPSDAVFQAVWRALRGRLARALQVRGLASASPHLLGIVGYGRWTGGDARGTRASDALDELTADAYSFAFVDRLPALRQYVRAGRPVDALIRKIVNDFVHERQARCDPLGSRLYTVLHAALKLLLDDGVLRSHDSSGRLRADSVLVFRQAEEASSREAPSEATQEALDGATAGWIGDLLPEIVTTTGRGVGPLVDRLRDRLESLPAQGVVQFRFGALIDPLRRRLRAAWAPNLADAAMPVAELDPAGNLLPFRLAPGQPIDRAFEARRRFTDLLDCVDRAFEDLAIPAEERALLRALWEALVDAACDRSDSPSGRGVVAGMPSQRQMAEILAISRDRVSTLYEMVRDLVRGCGEAVDLPVSGSSVMGETPEDGAQSLRRLQTRLQSEALAAAARTEAETSDGGRPPRPGDLFVLASGPDCEWFVIEVTEDRVRAAPADLSPLVGPNDWASPSGDPLGPLTIRIELASMLPRRSFDTAPPPRRPTEEQVDTILDRTAQPPTVASVEDPRLQDHLEELRNGIAAMMTTGETLAFRPPGEPSKPSEGSDSTFRTVPAWLAVAAAGVSALVGIGLYRAAAGDPTTPSFEQPAEELALGEFVRGDEIYTLRNGSSAIRLTIVLPLDRSCSRLDVTLEDPAGRVRWRELGIDLQPYQGELHLRLPRRFLRAGDLVIRTALRCGDEVLDDARKVVIVIE